MSDNHRRYCAIREALTQCYPGEISGRMTQHLTVLAAFIRGIVGSKSSQLPSIATKIADRSKPESRIKRLSRWLDNEHVKEEVYFLPYAERLLQCLALETLVLVMDGSGVGRGCCALMLHVVYHGRALPLAWVVRECPKGHAPEALHIELVELVSEIVPEGTKVVFLGDGEFDGIHLQDTMNDLGWFYACRTAKSTVVTWEEVTFHLDLLGDSIKSGMLIELKEVQFTRDAYGPVMVLCCWAKGEVEPLYLVSNMSLAEQAIKYYQKRFRIETFFSDQKRRGFNVQKSHLEDCQRLSRLLIAACLAYIWIVYLGSLCKTEGWQSVIHRKSRCDLSLFQLGLRLLDHFMSEGFSIPVQFYVII
jgi:DDE family transposase